jgi:hypothetical protein
MITAAAVLLAWCVLSLVAGMLIGRAIGRWAR